MQINASVDYAMRAIVAIAASGELVRKRDIAQADEIPERFLENLLAQLVRSGLLSATRGPQGGYALARPAAEITVADVVRALDGPLATVRGLAPEEVEYPPQSALIRDVWIAVRASMRVVLESTTIEDLLASSLPTPVEELLDQPGAWRRR